MSTIPEMVQRVARMLAAKDALRGMERAFTAEERAALLDDIYLPWVHFSDLARDIIAVMREPTQAMIEACGADDYYDSFDIRERTWSTMIDAALGGTP